MSEGRRTIQIFISLFILVQLSLRIHAQDLDPRAYVWVPTKGNFVSSGFAFSKGGILTDPTLPLENLKASVQTLNIGYLRSFNFLGKTANFFAALPYTWAQASADINGQRESTSRAGFSDIRMRFSVLLLGAPATPIEKFAQRKIKTILGLSLTASAPTGQYFSDKLINLGTNRWAFKPELALSHPIGKHWLIDVYAGVWLFTQNSQFYTGESLRTQDPLGSLQAHISYNINPKMWVAFDATYYAGGTSTLNGTVKDDRQSNSRIGGTFVFPVFKKSSIKLAGSTGAVIRSGANFNTFSIGWQTSWIDRKRKPVK